MPRFNQLIIKEKVRNHCPNVRVFRKALSWYRLKELNRFHSLETRVIASGDSPDTRKEILNLAKNKYADEYGKIDKLTRKTLQRTPKYTERANENGLLEDVLFCYFALGFLPDEYVYFALEKKDLQERMSFISDRETKRYHARVNDLADAGIFSDKGKTYAKFREFFQRDAIEISEEKDFERFNDFIEKHPSFISKRVYSSMGKGIEKIDFQTESRSPKEVFDELTRGGRCLLEELVIQCDETAAFNSSSVNTLRLYTALTRNGVVFPCAFFRTGRAGRFVDNAGSGGVIADVDTATGRLTTDGLDEFGELYTKHPDSGMTFKDYYLPRYEELLSMAEKLTLMLPSVKITGWDFACSNDGWCIIEGNPMGQLGVAQIPRQKGMKEEIDLLLQDIDLMI